jgi:beta-lactamase class A
MRAARLRPGYSTAMNRRRLAGETIPLVIASLLAGAPPADWAPDVRAAREFAATRTGVVSFHVRTEAEHWGLDADRAVPSASVIKAMLMVAYLNRPSVRHRD